jgi:sugar lactone lactonase YvrE
MKSLLHAIILIAVMIACEDPEVRKTQEIIVSTFAGGIPGDLDDLDTLARLRSPGHIVEGKLGEFYFTDTRNHKVKMITSDGQVITIAGSAKGYADGSGNKAMFNFPCGITISEDGTLFVTDSTSVRKVAPDGSSVTTLAGGAAAGKVDATGTEARFNSLGGIALRADGTLFVADVNNSLIRKITKEGVVTTLAGIKAGFEDADTLHAKFDHPEGLALAPDGTLYVADTRNHRLRKITKEGNVSTLAGDGSIFENMEQAIIIHPTDVNMITSVEMYIVDGRGKILQVTDHGKVSTVAGVNANGYVDGPSFTARFGSKQGILVSTAGAIYSCDSLNSVIRKIEFR